MITAHQKDGNQKKREKGTCIAGEGIRGGICGQKGKKWANKPGQ